MGQLGVAQGRPDVLRVSRWYMAACGRWARSDVRPSRPKHLSLSTLALGRRGALGVALEPIRRSQADLAELGY